MWAPLACGEPGPTAGRGNFGCWGWSCCNHGCPAWSEGVFWNRGAEAPTCGPGKPSRPGRPSTPGMPASPCNGRGKGQDAAPGRGAQGSCPLPCTPRCWHKAIPTSQRSYLWSWQARLSGAADLPLQGKRCRRHPYGLPAGILHGWSQEGVEGVLTFIPGSPGTPCKQQGDREHRGMAGDTMAGNIPGWGGGKGQERPYPWSFRSRWSWGERQPRALHVTLNAGRRG